MASQYQNEDDDQLFYYDDNDDRLNYHYDTASAASGASVAETVLNYDKEINENQKQAKGQKNGYELRLNHFRDLVNNFVEKKQQQQQQKQKQEQQKQQNRNTIIVNEANNRDNINKIHKYYSDKYNSYYNQNLPSSSSSISSLSSLSSSSSLSSFSLSTPLLPLKPFSYRFTSYSDQTDLDDHLKDKQQYKKELNELEKQKNYLPLISSIPIIPSASYITSVDKLPYNQVLSNGNINLRQRSGKTNTNTVKKNLYNFILLPSPSLSSSASVSVSSPLSSSSLSSSLSSTVSKSSRKLRNIHIEKTNNNNNKNNNNRIPSNYDDNDNIDTIQSKTKTSINGFKRNLTSTNLQQKQKKDKEQKEREIQQKDHKQQNKEIKRNFSEDKQLQYQSPDHYHNHHQYRQNNYRNHQQIRSIIDNSEPISAAFHQPQSQSQSSVSVFGSAPASASASSSASAVLNDATTINQLRHNFQNSDDISYDRINVSWIETAISLNTLIGATLIGLLIFGLLLTFWLKKIQKNKKRISSLSSTSSSPSSLFETEIKGKTKKSERNFIDRLKENFWNYKKRTISNSIINTVDNTNTNNNTLDQSNIINTLKVMEHEYKDTEDNYDSNDDKTTRKSSIQLENDFNDKLQLTAQTLSSSSSSSTPKEKKQRIYVDEKLSPIIIDDKNFIYTTTTPSISSSTTNNGTGTGVLSMGSSFVDSISSQSSSTSSLNDNRIPVPIPVPVPIPIPIPVPIPTPQQIYPQFINNSNTKDSSSDLQEHPQYYQKFHHKYGEKFLDTKSKTQQQQQQPILVKSLSLTTSSSSSPCSTPPISVAAGRRFSLYERRTQNFLQQQQHHYHPHNLSKTISHSEIGNLSITAQASPSSPIPSDQLIHHQLYQQKQPSSSAQMIVAIETGVTTALMKSSHGKCNSPKPQTSNTDDKENEIPAGEEIIYSPKMKLSEHVLAQQNSPRHFETPPSSASSITTTISRFSFSSKQNLHSETPASSPGIITTPITSSVVNSAFSTVNNNNFSVNSSPLLSSAVCKHGDYFKFPEVDCLTPLEKKINSSNSTITTASVVASTASHPVKLSQLVSSSLVTNVSNKSCFSNQQQQQQRDQKSRTIQSTINSQATRRSRLKSISLDSDGARLVEDNLGISVEELMEIANQSPKIVNECFVFGDDDDDDDDDGGRDNIDNDNVWHTDNEEAKLDRTKYNKENERKTIEQENSNEIKTISSSNRECHNHHYHQHQLQHQYQHKYSPLNKNCLTINIHDNETQIDENKSTIEGDDDNANLNNNSNVVTPKTPTLTQTKQKAISLDSSDTLIMHYIPLSHNLLDSTTIGKNPNLPNSATTSLLQISSISVPTTPKRQQLQMMCTSNTGRNKLINTKKCGNKYTTTSSTSPMTSVLKLPPSSSSSSSISGLSVAGKLSATNANSQLLSSSFDYHNCGSMQKQNSNQHFMMRKLRSFNENTIDVEDYDDHYFLDVVDGVVVVEEDNTSSSIYDDLDVMNACHFSSSNTNFLGANLLNQRCSTSLSLSNNNLKTLPEVMTLNDFTTNDEKQSCHHQLYIDEENKLKGKSSSTSTPTIVGQFSSSLTQITTQSPTSISGNVSGVQGSGGSGGGTGGIRTPRNSILQRRGSNHSLTLNLNGGSLGNLTKSLSVSNYSLGSTSFQNSQLNLSGSSYNLANNQQLNHQITMLNAIPVTGATSLAGTCMTDRHPSVSSITNFAGNPSANKKNLLQRRGSNTSLTLNIKGSSCMNLNRFSSHSSLNISSQQHQNYPPQQVGSINQIQQGGTTSNHGRKGLLERRNSNASLTLNIQNRALSISNCNLRGSACSLNSNATEYYEHQLMGESNIDPDHQHCDHEQSYGGQYCSVPAAAGVGTAAGVAAMQSSPGQHRKFLSSENLNVISQRTKLNQMHYRNLSKTCFGSVSDLNPEQNHQQSVIDQQQIIDGGGYPQNVMYINDEHFSFKDVGNFNGVASSIDTKFPFKQSNFCSCTGVRNITTRPLSPQSTSEDFKMYLANIQLLQNASNMLNNEHLKKLSYIFEKSYSNNNNMTPTNKGNKMDVNDKEESDKENQKQFDAASTAMKDSQKGFNDDIVNITISFELPNDDEQKSLLRNLHQEFWDLPTNFQEKPLVFGSQAKNRYKSILPNEHSRVILDAEPGYVQEPYINANYIKGPDYTQNSYIATQGPMSNTIYEYWLMIYQNIKKFISNTAKNDYNKQKSRPSLLNYSKNLTSTKSAVATVSIATATHATERSIDKNKSDNTTTIPRIADDSDIMTNNVFTDDRMKISSSPTTITTLITNKKNRKINKVYYNQKIVMLTDFIEHNKQKCSIYFPVEENELILITIQNEKIDNGELIEFYKEYLMKINNNETENKKNEHDNDNDDYDDENFMMMTLTKNLMEDSCNDVDDYDEIRTNFKEIKINYEDEKMFNSRPNMNYFVIKNAGIINKNGYTIRKFICLYCPKKGKLLSQQNNESKISKDVESGTHLIAQQIPDEGTERESYEQIVEKFECYHYWYPDWPDHRSPNDIGVLLDMSLHLLDGQCELEFKKKSETITEFCCPSVNKIELQPMPVIHCSAGIGRTGCLAAILNGLRQMRLSTTSLSSLSTVSSASSGSTDKTALPSTSSSIMEASAHVQCKNDDNQIGNINDDNGVNENVNDKKLIKKLKKVNDNLKNNLINVDVLAIVCNLRLQRGGMVQNSEQYELIHRTLCLYLKRLEDIMENKYRTEAIERIKIFDNTEKEHDDDNK